MKGLHGRRCQLEKVDAGLMPRNSLDVVLVDVPKDHQFVHLGLKHSHVFLRDGSSAKNQ